MLETDYVAKKALITFTQKRVLLTTNSEFNVNGRGNSNTINITIGDDIAKPLFITPYNLELRDNSHYPVGKSTCIHVGIGKKQYISVYRRYMPQNTYGNRLDPLFNIEIPVLDNASLNEALEYRGLNSTVKTQLNNGLVYSINQIIALFTNKQQVHFTKREAEIYADYEDLTTYPDFNELHEWLEKHATPNL